MFAEEERIFRSVHQLPCRFLTESTVWSSMIQRVALVVFVCIAAVSCTDRSIIVGAESARSYIISCARPSGGFGPRTQPYAEILRTADGAEACRILGMSPPYQRETARFLANEARTAESLREKHAIAVGATTYGIPLPNAVVAYVLRSQRPDGGWSDDDDHSTLKSTYYAVMILSLAGVTPKDPESTGQFVVDRLHRDGFISETPRQSESSQHSGDLERTFFGVRILQELGYDIPWKSSIVSWAQSCQTVDGGFTWAPKKSVYGSVWYTSLAAQTLSMLEQEPDDVAAAAAFTNSCQNVDGGFSDRPGEVSRLSSTADALRALRSLVGSASSAITSKPCTNIAPKYTDFWTSDSVFAIYSGPCSQTPHSSESRIWSRGIPMYHVDTEIDAILSDLALDEAKIRDSVVTTFLVSFKLATIPLRLANGSILPQRFDVWMPNGCQPDTLAAVRSVWQRASESPANGYTWTEIYRRVVTPIVSRGGFVCWHADFHSRFDASIAIDALTDAGSPVGFVVAAADFGGADYVRSNPEIERLEGVTPFVVSGAKEHLTNERARTLWFSRDQTPDGFRKSLSSRKSAVAITPIDARQHIIYGTPEIRGALRSRTDWVWYQSRPGG